MTVARRLTLVAAAWVALFGCRGGMSGRKITLRYRPPAGAAYHYALEQQNSMKFEGGPMAAMPAQQFTMRMYYTQAVTGPATGGIGVTVTFDSTAMEAPGMGPGAMGPALDRMRGLKSNIVYDERRHVVSASFSGLAGMPSPITEQMGRNIKGMSFPLPDGPVGVGDSWTTETELPLGHALGASAPLKSRTKLTVKDIRVGGADTAVLFAVETSFPSDPVTVSQQGQSVTMQLSGSLAGEQLYSLTKGAPVHSAMGGTVRINVKGGQAGPQGMTMAMEQQTSLQLTGAK